jgi:hypothetical protein
MDNTETQTTLNTRKQEGQSGMDNTETQTTLITRHRTKTNKIINTTQKIKR